MTFRLTDGDDNVTVAGTNFAMTVSSPSIVTTYISEPWDSMNFEGLGGVDRVMFADSLVSPFLTIGVNSDLEGIGFTGTASLQQFLGHNDLALTLLPEVGTFDEPQFSTMSGDIVADHLAVDLPDDMDEMVRAVDLAFAENGSLILNEPAVEWLDGDEEADWLVNLADDLLELLSNDYPS